jgi:dihydrofolate reductase
MRKLILKMSMSLDGFVGGPNGEIDWIFGSMNPEVMDWLSKTLWEAGVHIMGSRTYQDMVAYWPRSSDLLAAPMNQIPKMVFSRKGKVLPNPTLTTTAFVDASKGATPLGEIPADMVNGWSDPKIASGDLTDEISRLKRESGKDILAHGGAGFARSLVSKGLVDEFRLLTHPVALGVGLPLFSDLPEPLHLRLANVTTFGSGAVAHIYRPQGR